MNNVKSTDKACSKAEETQNPTMKASSGKPSTPSKQPSQPSKPTQPQKPVKK